MIRDNSLHEYYTEDPEVVAARKAVEEGIKTCLKQAGVRSFGFIGAPSVTLTYNTTNVQSIPEELREFISSHYGSRDVTAKEITASHYSIDIDAWALDTSSPYAKRTGYIVVPDREIAVSDQLHLSLLAETEGEHKGQMTFGLREHPLLAAMKGDLKNEPAHKEVLDPKIVKVIAGMLPEEMKPPSRLTVLRMLGIGTDTMAYINRHLRYPHRRVEIPL